MEKFIIGVHDLNPGRNNIERMEHIFDFMVPDKTKMDTNNHKMVIGHLPKWVHDYRREKYNGDNKTQFRRFY